MAGNTAAKTLVIGLAGLYAVKVIADQQPPKTNVAHVQERITHAPGAGLNVGQHPLQEVHDTSDQSLSNLKKYIQLSGDEASQRAMSIYDEAYSKVLDAKKKLDDASSSGSNKFWADGTNEEILKKNYDEASKRLADLKKYLNDYVDSANSGISENIKKGANVAQGYASDAYSKLVGSKESAEDVYKGNAEYFSEKAREAKKEWDDTKSSWFKWRKAQSKEVQDRAEAKYNFFKQRSDSAISQLTKYLEESGQDAKKIVDDFNKELQRKASQAADKASQVKEDAISKGYDLKDAAGKHVENAKDSVKENADTAKLYAEGYKDRAVQAGYDAKEAAGKHVENAKDSVKENADTAKLYAEGYRDRAVQAGYDAKEAIDEQGEYMKKKLYNAKDAVADTASDVKDIVDENGKYIKNKAYDAKDAAAEGASNAKEYVGENVEYLRDQAAKAKEDAINAGSDARGYVDSKASDIKSFAHENIDYAKDKASEVSGDVKESVDENAKYAKNKYVDVKERVAQAGYDTNEKIKDDAKYVKDSVQDGAESAKNWLGSVGSATKNFFVDKYNSLYNSLGIFRASTLEIAEEAAKYYDEEVAKAKKEYDEARGGWFGLKRAKPQEIQDAAREHWEILKAKQSAAHQELQRWKSKTNKK
ncbi:hypothetical protein CAS74_003530 [Pichia kudriavzevii]|uniref:Embryonic protein DC-8 n=1 Tax=Pichia kudriavzevii TaxID=4909 RepID=A0A1Z8JLV3_PICKU|nr:hypothetical protein CAS74_003530 [Pichia kudriavzevii]